MANKSEVVFGLVGATGTDMDLVSNLVEACLKLFGYSVKEISVSGEVIPIVGTLEEFNENDEFERISALMNAGNEARKNSDDNAILALGLAARISQHRTSSQPEQGPRAYIVRSLKHPDEVTMLRGIYDQGFFLIGVYSDREKRITRLREKIQDNDKIQKLIARDEDEHLEHGQRTRDTFHLADLFLYADDTRERIRKKLWRHLDLIFGHPLITPTFDEYAMFLAFSASLRSADLSRQVGAVIAISNDIIATGANDCPAFDGGVYWPQENESGEIVDFERGRDYKRDSDSNVVQKQKIVDDIVNQLHDLVDVTKMEDLKERVQESILKDITEYGRVVHAEMEALISCARRNVNCQGATLYSTTYPCHNCAKHIIAAGIRRVVYVEPYAKSKALEFHDEAIAHQFFKEDGNLKKVCFEPFIGVGPRRFFDLFSMRLGSGSQRLRKDDLGNVVKWDPSNAEPRLSGNLINYLENETAAALEFKKVEEGEDHGSQKRSE